MSPMETENGNDVVQDVEGLISAETIINTEDGTILLVDLMEDATFTEQHILQTEKLAESGLHIATENTSSVPLNEICVSEVVVEVGSHIAVPSAGQVDVLLPAEVGAETVIQTSPKKRRKQTKPRSWSQSGRLGHTSDSDVLDGSDGLIESSIWSQLGFSKSDGVGLAEAELSPHESFVALEPDNTLSKEAIKRQKDRIKKRELRANPSYREKEKEKAKSRMKSRRDDPLYRANERERDRERRRNARQKNNEVRQRERERDKIYKRSQRTRNEIILDPLEEFSTMENKSDVSLPSEIGHGKLHLKDMPLTDTHSMAEKMPVFIFSTFGS